MPFQITLPRLRTFWRWTLVMRACWSPWWHLLPRALSSRRQRLRRAVLPRMPSFRVTCWKTSCRSMQGTHPYHPCLYFPAAVKVSRSWGATSCHIMQGMNMSFSQGVPAHCWGRRRCRSARHKGSVQASLRPGCAAHGQACQRWWCAAARAGCADGRRPLDAHLHGAAAPVGGPCRHIG